MREEALLSHVMDMGEALLQNGAEIYRVEDSVKRVLKAYGAQRAEVFAIPSLIVVTLKMPCAEPFTQTRRIVRCATNLDAVARLNSLCRYLCAHRPDLDVADQKLQQVLSVKPYSAWMILFAYILASFSFAVFFGGTWMDGLASGIGGTALFIMVHFVGKLNISAVFTHLIGAAVIALCALGLYHLGIGEHVDKVVIGNIMLLIPGLELTNGMRDFFSGDILAGLLHIGEAIFLATMIALGIAYILQLGGAI